MQVSLIVSCYGACTSYLVIVGDMMSPLIGVFKGCCSRRRLLCPTTAVPLRVSLCGIRLMLGSTGQWMGGTPADFCSMYAHRHFSISLALVVVAPLSMARHLDSLRYASYLVRLGDYP